MLNRETVHSNEENLSQMWLIKHKNINNMISNIQSKYELNEHHNLSVYMN
jgi:hypothetical protein